MAEGKGKQAREPLFLLHLQQTQTHGHTHTCMHDVCTWNRFYASSAPAVALLLLLLRAPAARADEAPTPTNI